MRNTQTSMCIEMLIARYSSFAKIKNKTQIKNKGYIFRFDLVQSYVKPNYQSKLVVYLALNFTHKIMIDS